MSVTDRIVSRAESFESVRAAVVGLAEVLKGPSYRSVSTGSPGMPPPAATGGDPAAGSLLVLGLRHPESDLRLDWWEAGDSWGNRRLREISESLRRWLGDQHGLTAHPLPYHLEKGGIFLKDAAVLSGLGVIGRNNLLLHRQWGPRIRLRSLLIEADLPLDAPRQDFNPCLSCEKFCQKACPVNAFAGGHYSRSACNRQMRADESAKQAAGQIDNSGKPGWVIRYCRACELACPVGAPAGTVGKEAAEIR